MKMTTLKSVAIAVGLASSAFGQATSPVVGYVTEDLAVGFNPVGVTLHNKVLTSGVFTSELTDAAAAFTTILDSFPTKTYLLEIVSGDQAGAVAEITAATDTTLTLAAPIIAGAVDYQIREASTLDDLFGGQLAGGSTSGTADIVFLPNGSGGFDQFFFSTIGNEFRPTTAAFTDVTDPISVFYPDGLFIQVRAVPKSVVIAGDLKASPTVLAANSGFNLVASPGPVGVTLGESELSSFLQGASTSGAADIVFNAESGGFTQYFFSSIGNTWRLTTSAFAGNESGTELSSAFFIQRRGASTAGVANLPDFYVGL